MLNGFDLNRHEIHFLFVQLTYLSKAQAHSFSSLYQVHVPLKLSISSEVIGALATLAAAAGAGAGADAGSSATAA